MLTALVLVVVLATPVWWSLGSTLTNPAAGSTVGTRFVEWVRDHGGSRFVVWAEHLWYEHHQPPKGGTPAKGAIPPPTASTLPIHSTVAHLAPPAPIQPFTNPPIAGEGQWHPAGKLVDGLPAVYEAYMRPDPVHTSLVIGVAWMDTKLLQATLHPGTFRPGGGPWPVYGDLQPSEAATVVAAFNSGFRMQDAQGGFYAEGRTAGSLQDGIASFVIYSNGTATVGQWGRDVSMSPAVVAVRQNLHLLVDGGKPVSGLNANDTTKWGFTLGNGVYVWRSGVGVTATGALVYVGGPGLNITTLADCLVRAGAVRAMELDINTDWVNLTTYSPANGALAAPANGTTLLPGMTGGAARYFPGGTGADYFTMSASNSSNGAGTH